MMSEMSAQGVDMSLPALADNPILVFLFLRRGARTFNNISMDRCTMATVDELRIQCELLFAGAKTPYADCYPIPLPKVNGTSFENIDNERTVSFFEIQSKFVFSDTRKEKCVLFRKYKFY